MFLNIRFPTTISYGATGGPSFETDVIEFDSGHEQRNQRWTEGRCEYEVAEACKTDQMRKDLIAFFRIARGMTYSFRLRDFSDYQVESGEGVIGTLGNGQFQLYKRYFYSSSSTGSPNADKTYDRLISLPLSAQLYAGASLLTSGVHYSLNELTGIVTMIGSPTIIPTAWLGQFDVRVRFGVKSIRLTAEDKSTNDLLFFRSQGITLIECRVEDEA